jgi:acyl homoserine lactone synthase
MHPSEKNIEAKSIRIAPREAFDADELTYIHQLRAKVFKDRMGWNVSILGGMEIDGYDALNPYYMAIYSEDDTTLHGCWRLLPADGPYMLKDTFPELLCGCPAPEGRQTWELSRFAIETGGTQGFGFTDLTLIAMREIVTFGDRMNIEHYVTVTTLAVERLLRRTGIETRRFGPPKRIGGVDAVALDISLGAQTRQALFSPP